MKGRSKDKETNELVTEALMCKMWSCRPSELEQEDYDKVVKFGLIYMELMKKNPMMAF